MSTTVNGDINVSGILYGDGSGLTNLGLSATANVANEAVQLQTARNISLAGDATGSTTFDGSSDVVITVTIDGSNHAHDAAQIVSGTISDDRLPATITSDITGNANTATALETSRTITISGDASGSVSFDGTTNVNIVTDVPDLVFGYNAMSTGLKAGGELSVNANNVLFDVEAGHGYVIDNVTDPSNPDVTYVSWSAFNGISPTNIATQPVTYILINSAGAIVQQQNFPDAQDRRTSIFLGVIVHSDNTIVNVVNNLPDVAFDVGAQVQDVLAILGFRSITGNQFVPSSNANLTFDKSAGTAVRSGANFHTDPYNPHVLTLPAQEPATFRYRSQTSVEGTDTQNIDPLNYDNGGVLTAVPGSTNRATLQRVFLFPSNSIRIQRGQEWYNTLAEAVSVAGTETFVTETNISENALFLGTLAVRKGASDLTDPNDAKFIPATQVASVIGSVTTLQQAYDVSSPPEITTASDIGALTIRRGSAADTDNVIEIENGAGTVTWGVSGHGNVSANGATFTGSFTSVGINDDATSEKLLLGDTIMHLGSAGQAYTIGKADNTSYLALSSCTTESTGSNILMYGSGHPTTPNDILFRKDAADLLRWDDSDDRWEFTKPIDVQGNIDLTGTLTTTGGNVDVTGNILVTGTVDGRDISADGTLLDSITGNYVTTDTAQTISGVKKLTANVTIGSTVTAEKRLQIDSPNYDEHFRMSRGLNYVDFKYSTDPYLMFAFDANDAARIDAVGVSAPDSKTIMTREKGDARYIEVAGDTMSGRLTSTGGITAYSNSSTSTGFIQFGRDTNQFIDMHGGATGNYITSRSSTTNAKGIVINATTVASHTVPSAGVNFIGLDIRGNRIVQVNDSEVEFNAPIYMASGQVFQAAGTNSRDKIRVYNSSNYSIGMQQSTTYGDLNDWAMTFQMNDDSDRGFWWGHVAHTVNQGAMSLTTDGELTVAKGVRVGAGESDATGTAAVDSVIVTPVAFGNNQDSPYLIASATNWNNTTTNWGTEGFKHSIKTDGSGAARITIDTPSAGESFAVYDSGHTYALNRLYVNSTSRYLSQPGGDYGSLQINGSGVNSWEGFSIDGRAVFMHDGSSTTGLYNDVNNEWLVRCVHNAEVELYHNGSLKMETTSGGVEVFGDLVLDQSGDFIQAREMRTQGGQHMAFLAGETSSVFNHNDYSTQEIVIAAAENGFRVISSPDNWGGSGWAGRQEAVICNSSGESSFPGDVLITGGKIEVDAPNNDFGALFYKDLNTADQGAVVLIACDADDQDDIAFEIRGNVDGPSVDKSYTLNSDDTNFAVFGDGTTVINQSNLGTSYSPPNGAVLVVNGGIHANSNINVGNDTSTGSSGRLIMSGHRTGTTNPYAIIQAENRADTSTFDSKIEFFSGSANGSTNIKFVSVGGTDGDTEYTLRWNSAGELYPDSDNVSPLGKSGNRWSVVYAGTGTINTSDANAKTDIVDISETELLVAKDAKKLIKRFRFKDAVEEKSDGARYHFGVIAQELEQAFLSHGLDPWKYGIMCKDAWWEFEENGRREVVYDEQDAPEGAVYVERLGVRYEELLAFIIAAI